MKTVFVWIVIFSGAVILHTDTVKGFLVEKFVECLLEEAPACVDGAFNAMKTCEGKSGPALALCLIKNVGMSCAKDVGKCFIGLQTELKLGTENKGNLLRAEIATVFYYGGEKVYEERHALPSDQEFAALFALTEAKPEKTLR